jgi:hypothetical protein
MSDNAEFERYEQQGNQLAKALGLISLNFSTLEHTIQMFIALMIEKSVSAKTPAQKTYFDNLSFLITSELPFRGIAAMFESLYKYVERDAARIPELTELIGRAFDLEGKRNRFIHSRYTYARNRPDPLRMKTTAKHQRNKPHNYKTDFTSTPIAELEKLADDIWELEQTLIAFMGKRGYSL